MRAEKNYYDCYWLEKIKQKVDLSTCRLVVQKIDGVYESLAEAGADGEYSGGLTCEITICDLTIMERYK